MGLGLLRRAVGKGSRSGRSGRSHQRRDTNAAAEKLRSLPAILDAARVGAARDVEASPGPRRRVVREARHGMQCCEHSGDGDGEYLRTASQRSAGFGHSNDRFFHFYNEKVRELQEKGGDIDHCPISGNLYLYRALAHFGDSSGLFQEKASPVVMVGLIIVIVCQLLGPICIIFWSVHKIEFYPNGTLFGTTESFKWVHGSNEYGLSHRAQKILGVMFLLLFSANGLFVLRQDKESTQKVVNMCKVFRRAAEVSQYDPPQEWWLYFGALANSTCLLLCCVSMCFCFVLADDGPKDVLFDAFGLTFLYNLDDVGGDLAFLDEKWDEGQMGDIYGMLADELGIMEDIQDERENSFTADNLYSIFEVIVSLLIVCLPLAFIFLEMKPKSD